MYLVRHIKRITLVIIILIVAIPVIWYGGLWVQYYLALERERQEWFRNEYVLKSFSGVVSDIDEYSFDSDALDKYVGLTIQAADSEQIHYGSLSLKKEPLLKTFVAVGDSIKKVSNNKTITVTKANGQTKTFELPYDVKK